MEKANQSHIQKVTEKDGQLQANTKVNILSISRQHNFKRDNKINSKINISKRKVPSSLTYSRTDCVIVFKSSSSLLSKFNAYQKQLYLVCQVSKRS